MGRRRLAIITAAAALGACNSETGPAEAPTAASSDAASVAVPSAVANSPAKSKRLPPPRVDPAALYDPPTVDAKPPDRIGQRRSAPDFPDVTLMTHEGEEVEFYTDLIKGKIVAINFMFATCGGT